MAHVVIVGGGFGGLAAGNELADLLGPLGPNGEHQVTIVDRRDDFFMGFAKLAELAGTRSLASSTRSLAGLADRGISHLRAEVTAIDAANRRVVTSEGELVADHLIIALGTVTAPAHSTLLSESDRFNLYEVGDLAGIKQAVGAIESGRIVVAIVGGPHQCPPAPYEAAMIIDDLLRARGVRDDVEVHMTTPKAITLPVAGVDASAYVARHLADHEIPIHTEHAVAGVDGRTLQFKNGTSMDFDVLVGIPAQVAPPVVAACGLIGPSGWIEVDRGSFATSIEDVYAVGDCTMIPTSLGQLPMAGVFAAAGGRTAARNIAASLGEGEPDTFAGEGYCFLELPGEKVAYVEGNFYDDPMTVTLTPADHEHFERKLAFEQELLDAWLGPR